MILDDGSDRARESTSTSETDELGYFGNIWVRKHYLPKKGDKIEGHKHYFDHVSLLVRGSVSVQIPGDVKKVFKAPTFVVIRKETEHAIISEEDDTVWFCVFAIRDLNGEVLEGEENIVSAINDPSGNSLHPKFKAQTFDASDELLDLLRETTIQETTK